MLRLPEQICEVPETVSGAMASGSQTLLFRWQRAPRKIEFKTRVEAQTGVVNWILDGVDLTPQRESFLIEFAAAPDLEVRKCSTAPLKFDVPLLPSGLFHVVGIVDPSCCGLQRYRCYAPQYTSGSATERVR